MKKLSIALTLCLPLGLFATETVNALLPQINTAIVTDETTQGDVLDPIAKLVPQVQQEQAAQRFIDVISVMQTFQAKFDQLSVSNNRNAMQESSGTLKIKKPGKYAWIIDAPRQSYELSNAKKLWKYDVDLEEVDIDKVSEKNNQFMRLLQIEETSELLNEYQIIADQYGDESVFSFIPHENQYEVSQITISFVAKKLNNIRIQTDLAQATLFDFSEVVINEPIKDSMFELAIPEGVDVYDNTLF